MTRTKRMAMRPSVYYGDEIVVAYDPSDDRKASDEWTISKLMAVYANDDETGKNKTEVATNYDDDVDAWTTMR